MFDWVSERARIISTRYKDIRSVLVVGSGANEGTAEEIALKYDEMSHIPTKAMCAGRHIHGALGLTQPNILTIVVAPLEDPGYKELRDIAQVTYMLKSPSMALISEDDEAVAEQVDDVFRLRRNRPDPVLDSGDPAGAASAVLGRGGAGRHQPGYAALKHPAPRQGLELAVPERHTLDHVSPIVQCFSPLSPLVWGGEADRRSAGVRGG